MNPLQGQYHGFRVEHEDEVTVIALENPGRRNALDLTTKRELADLIFQLNIDGGTRCILVTGSGGDFCAGDDMGGPVESEPGIRKLTSGVPQYVREPAHTYRIVRSVTQSLMRALLECDVPTVAAIDGFAVQSGLTLALCCDLRVASDSARLGSGTLRFAMLPDEGGHQLLISVMGLSRATQFILMSEFLSAEDAKVAGLVHELTGTTSARERGLEIARQLAEKPATAVRLTKRAIRRAADAQVVDSFDFIALAAAVSDYDQDMQRGRQYFRDRSIQPFRRFTQASESQP